MQPENIVWPMISVSRTLAIFEHLADDSIQCSEAVTCANETGFVPPPWSVFAKLLQPTAVSRVYHISSG